MPDRAVDAAAAQHPEPGSSRRRGRPRREEGPAVTADAIVGLALDAVQANGWSGLALRDLARRLGVSLPAVQRHFPTKDDLWRACVDRIVAERLAVLSAPSPAPPAALLLDTLRAQLERAGSQPALTAAMLQDRSEGAAERLDYLCTAIGPAVDAARDQLRAAIGRGAVRAVDEDVVLALVGIGLGSLAAAGPALHRVFGIDVADADQRERFAAALSDVLINGLRGPAVPPPA